MPRNKVTLTLQHRRDLSIKRREVFCDIKSEIEVLAVYKRINWALKNSLSVNQRAWDIKWK